MHSRFPVRPRPQLNESFVGYLLRLASENGFFPLRAIFTVTNYKFSQKCFDVTNPQFESFIKVLAPTLMLDEKHLYDAFKDSQSFDRVLGRSIYDITSFSPQICTTCLKQSEGYLRHHWQHMHNTHCDEHITALISHCPCCQSRLSWDADLLNGCSSCGLRWSDFSALPVPELPQYQSVAQSFPGQQLTQYLTALYDASICVYTPFDLLREQKKTCPFSEGEAQEVFETAYWLLASGESTEYTETLMRELAKPLMVFNTDTLKTIIHPISKLPKISLPPSLKQRDKVNMQCPQTSIISDGQASNLLGISIGELNELAKANVIVRRKSTRASFYELKHIDQFMNDLLCDAITLIKTPGSELYSLSNLSKLSHKYLYNFGDALKLMLDTKANLYRSRTASSLGEVYVEKMSLIQCLEEHETSQFSRLLSMSELTTYFGVQHVKIRLIAKVFEWRKVQVNRNSAQYESSDIAAFVEKYLLLDKWCDQQLYPKSSLYKYLLNHNIEPIDNPYEEKSKLHIFKKSDVLFATIQQFEKDWFKSKAPYQLKERMNITQPPVLSESANQAFLLRCSPT